jgi:hypothetical protein
MSATQKQCSAGGLLPELPQLFDLLGGTRGGLSVSDSASPELDGNTALPALLRSKGEKNGKNTAVLRSRCISLKRCGLRFQETVTRSRRQPDDQTLRPRRQVVLRQDVERIRY